ncbi:hypothetical protein NDU88_002430 [Pleurodeles waltl]|uniref:Uncharacterized protein n=1 Tax=Pleurodeles waltl TaxID=8319 RepID=A0AAV7KVN4_PLEWA|nr:hypothetical protein NDU88_002430 [Pleurodeles waltl]
MQAGWPCPEQCHQLRLRQQELRNLADGRAMAHVLAVQQRRYDMGDKANKLTVWFERRDRGRNWVVTVRDAEGQECKTSGDITEAFADYYEWLYESRVEYTRVECAELLGDFSLCTLTAEDCNELAEELSEEKEVGQALQDL